MLKKLTKTLLLLANAGVVLVSIPAHADTGFKFKHLLQDLTVTAPKPGPVPGPKPPDENTGVKTKADGSLEPSCQAYWSYFFQTEGTVADGFYRIELPDGEQADVFCDMTTDDGGWTRLTVNVATFDGPLDANDALVRNFNPPLGCTHPAQVQFTVTNIKVPAVKVRMDLTRATISQCSELTNVFGNDILTETRAYFDGTRYQPLASVCSWNLPNWANSTTDVSLGTLPAKIRLQGHMPLEKEIAYRGNCSVAEDKGAYSATLYVR